jgi:hypothetical protein
MATTYTGGVLLGAANDADSTQEDALRSAVLVKLSPMLLKELESAMRTSEGLQLVTGRDAVGLL